MEMSLGGFLFEVIHCKFNCRNKQQSIRRWNGDPKGVAGKIHKFRHFVKHLIIIID